MARSVCPQLSVCADCQPTVSETNRGAMNHERVRMPITALRHRSSSACVERHIVNKQNRSQCIIDRETVSWSVC